MTRPIAPRVISTYYNIFSSRMTVEWTRGGRHLPLGDYRMLPCADRDDGNFLRTALNSKYIQSEKGAALSARARKDPAVDLFLA